MVQIRQTPKIDEGSKGFLGDLSPIAKIAGTIASVVPGGQPVGAALLAGSTLNDMTARQGSVSQAQGVQQQGGAMQRRLQDLMAPSQLQAPQADPGLEILRRRYGNLG